MQSDVSMVVCYAPWDFDSQMLRKELEIVGHKLKDQVSLLHPPSCHQFPSSAFDNIPSQVYFAAINCWYVHGECHKQFPKIKMYPLLLVYAGGLDGIEYRGPLRHSYISRFLDHIIRPLDRVETAGDLLQLLSNSHAS